MSIERLEELFHELDCIKYGTFKLASGGISNYKIVCDSLFKNPEAREILGTLGYEMLCRIEDGKKREIVGVVTGGHEFAKLVAERAERAAVAVNPHNGEVSGNVTRDRVCYFEDVVTKGSSILKCRSALRKYDGKDKDAIAIVDREEGGKENLIRNGIRLMCILTKSDLEVSIT